MNELHLFAGAGGGILGSILLGHTCVCAVEIEPYCRKVLLQRQRDGILPKFPIWDDVRTFDGSPWRGLVDVVCGGFPCQDISAAGKGAGIGGERSGLWKEMASIIRVVRPRYVFVENSPMLSIRGLGTVLRDLAEAGYDARRGVFSGKDVHCIHLRQRLFLLANDNQRSRHPSRPGENKGGATEPSERSSSLVHNSHNWKERIQGEQQEKVHRQSRFPWRESIRRVEDLFDRPDIPKPLIRRMDDVVADYVDRISAIGNGQVPAVVELAWKTLTL